MKKYTLLLIAALCMLYGCNKETDGCKLLSSKDYEITVASRKLEGVLTASGSNVKTNVLVIKKEGSNTWEALGGVIGFDYEAGYEYRLKINETHYLDYRMGEPAWAEHKLLNVISKEKKDTEGLPENFIPDWFKQ